MATKSASVAPELANVFCCLGKIVGEIDFAFLHAPQLVDGELETVLVFVDQSLDLEEIILLERIEKFLDVVPHLGFDLPRPVAKSQCQVRLAILFRLHLLRHHHEARGDHFVFLLGTFGDEELFHEPPRISFRCGRRSARAPFAAPLSSPAKISLKHPKLLPLFQFLRRHVLGGGLDRLGLLGARTGVDVPRLDVDEGLFAQRG